MSITTLIADDEPLARDRLRDLLEEIGGLSVVGETADGDSTLAAIETMDPAVVFLDIKMPGLSGLEVLGRTTRQPHVVFTTAFAEHAISAFELNALDYVLKPLDLGRLKKTVNRVKHALRADSTAGYRLTGVFDDGPLERLFVRQRRAIVPIAVTSIARVEARGDYVAIYADGARHIMRLTMQQIEARLDPQTFIRLHRSHLVNLKFISAFKPHDNTRLHAELTDGTVIVVSRAVSKRLRHLSA